MKRLLLAAAIALLTALPAHGADIEGSWTASVSDKHPDRLQLTLVTDEHGQQSSGFLVEGFTGLARAQIESETRVPVEFRLEREAGTVFLEGTFRRGRGSGEFRFSADPKYTERIRALGVRGTSRKDEEDLLHLALFDVSTAFIRSMQAIGYDETLDQYVAFRIFGVDPEYVREMEQLGFKRLSGDKLVATRIHGATPDYIREMREHGENLPLDKYIESRIFQISPEFAGEMAKAGYPNLSRDVLTQFRIHGVTPEFIAELSEAGYSRLPAQKLVEMRIHNVTPEFIRRVEKAGYRKVPVDKLIQMRIFNVDPEMVRALDEQER